MVLLASLSKMLMSFGTFLASLGDVLRYVTWAVLVTSTWCNLFSIRIPILSQCTSSSVLTKWPSLWRLNTKAILRDFRCPKRERCLVVLYLAFHISQPLLLSLSITHK